MIRPAKHSHIIEVNCAVKKAHKEVTMGYVQDSISVSVIGTAIALFLLPVDNVPAQPAPPPAGAVAPIPHQPHSTVNGTVVQYLMNHHGDIDGLLLEDGNQVHIPPHMGKELAATVKPHDPVTVQGYRSPTGPVIVSPVITNTRTGQSVTEYEPGPFDRPILPPHVKDMFLAEKHTHGIVQTLLYGPRGEINGVVLDNHVIIRIPPHTAQHTASLLQPGHSIDAVGYGTENQYGLVIEATAMGATGSTLRPIQDAGSAGPRR